MIIVKDNKFLPVSGYSAITLYPFVFVDTSSYNWKNEEKREVLIRHEAIHIEQQKELLVLPFYLLYVIFILKDLLKYRNYKKAYRNNIFEIEAYNNDENEEYLENRIRYNYFN